jgi:hypothetical protein
MIWPFRKKRTDVKSLYQNVKKKQRKDWEKRLDSAVKLSDAMLRCEYNKDRLQEDILNDVRKCFKGCNVCFQHENGQTTIIITWHEQQ